MRELFKSVMFLALLVSITQPAFSQTNRAIVFPKLPTETKTFLLTASEFILFSLDPDLDFEHKAKITFKEHRVIGSTSISATEERTNLVKALEYGIANGAGAADCFDPRHGIRAKKGDQTIECLICFECGTVLVYSNTSTNGYVTSKDPSKTFNAYLAIHKVRVANH
jgi:hypothetical protein